MILSIAIPWSLSIDNLNLFGNVFEQSVQCSISVSLRSNITE